MNAKILPSLSILALASATVLGACKDKPEPSQAAAIEQSFDESEVPEGERKAVPGVDLSQLDTSEAARFEKLIDTLSSPCGKAHSLRTSRNTDSSCNRASFAVDYVFALVKDGGTDSEIRKFYDLRFRDSEEIKLVVSSDEPHHGPTDASVVVVEFYDYGCPACENFKQVLDVSLSEYENDVVVYYKQFPLPGHTDSPGAAQAAIAAGRQGKFDEMHQLLFANQHSHKMDDLETYAGELGLDMAKWKSDYKSAAALVEKHRSQGKEAGVSSTPVTYINGKRYEGPPSPKYFNMWLEQSLAEAI
ncbi:MAG: thioredoxin domain-containing protein [Kofleriaceae bacterium]|nr:thioredoxin domain-containing protein [Kofleriaceae bacterium]